MNDDRTDGPFDLKERTDRLQLSSLLLEALSSKSLSSYGPVPLSFSGRWNTVSRCVCTVRNIQVKKERGIKGKENYLCIVEE